MNERDMAKHCQNWYVLQTISGNEHRLMKQCQLNIDKEYMYDICVPLCQVKKKYEGRWHISEERVFPGYIFFRSNNPYMAALKIRKLSGFRRILKTDDEFIPLDDAESLIISRLIGEDGIIEMSYGIIENDRIIITEGPLEGLEGNIRKIDRHKRKALIEIEMAGIVHQVTCGLEIVRKSMNVPELKEL